MTGGRIGLAALATVLVPAIVPPVLPGRAAGQMYEPNGDIWKYRVPKGTIRGEFDNEDVMGVIAGKHIRTDCSVNWVGADGRIYCFTAAASQTLFKYAPNTNADRARDAWNRLDRGPSPPGQ